MTYYKKSKTHKQKHYFLVIQLILLIAVMLAISQGGKWLSPLIVTLAVLGYFVSNTMHAYFTNRLSAKLVLEYGIVSLVCELLMLNYVI